MATPPARGRALRVDAALPVPATWRRALSAAQQALYDARQAVAAASLRHRALADDTAAGVTVQRALSYGADRAQCLDLYQPQGGAAGAPLAVVVGHGDMVEAARAAGSLVATPLTGRGYLVAYVGLRRAGRHGAEASLADLGLAEREARRLAAALDADDRPPVMVGLGSGADLVAAHVVEAARAGADRPRAVALCGATGWLLDSDLPFAGLQEKHVTSGRTDVAAASACDGLRRARFAGSLPPFFLAAAGLDASRPLPLRLSLALRGRGGDVWERPFPTGGTDLPAAWIAETSGKGPSHTFWDEVGTFFALAR